MTVKPNKDKKAHIQLTEKTEFNDFLKDLQVVLNGYISIIGYQEKGYSQVPME